MDLDDRIDGHGFAVPMPLQFSVDVGFGDGMAEEGVPRVQHKANAPSAETLGRPEAARLLNAR